MSYDGQIRLRITYRLFEPDVWIAGLDALDLEVDAGEVSLHVRAVLPSGELLATPGIDPPLGK